MKEREKESYYLYYQHPPILYWQCRMMTVNVDNEKTYDYTDPALSEISS